MRMLWGLAGEAVHVLPGSWLVSMGSSSGQTGQGRPDTEQGSGGETGVRGARCCFLGLDGNRDPR